LRSTESRSDKVEEYQDLKDTKLLVVSKNRTNCEVMQRYAMDWGVRYQAELSGESAFSRIQQAVKEQKPFDVIVIDMTLKDMEGRELTERIRSLPNISTLPIINITSTLYKEKRTADNQANDITAYVAKPVRKRELYRAMLKVLGKPGSDNIDTVTKPTLSNKIQLPGKILLADDNVVNQEVVILMLQGYGCKVKVVSNGKEAVESLLKESFDLVFMDCMMPIMDGYAATAEIRRLEQTGQIAYAPIIALTANAIEGDREKCLASGMDDYLAKPFTTRDLERVIKVWLGYKDELHVVPNEEALLLAEENDVIIDQEVLTGLQTLVPEDHDVLERMIMLYLANANSLLLELEHAWREKNTDNIRDLTHALKSSSLQIGAFRFAEKCRIVETDFRHNHCNYSEETITDLYQLFSEAETELSSYLNQAQTKVT
jgi:CheY-like chemotaxis protein/HPt (histidine-containing phosphotransfer) domain-containing protein